MKLPNSLDSEDGLPPLPALKSLGFLAKLMPTVIIDTREQDPLPITRLPVIREGLTTGDYSFAGGEHLFAVERKSIADLVACCVGDNRARFERELHRLRGFWFKRLLVIGRRQDIEAGKYRSAIQPKAVLHTLDAFEARYEVPLVWFDEPAAAGRWIEDKVWFAAREVVVRANSLRRTLHD